MELFYNPERISETEIKETFVAYEWLVDELISILKRQPKGAGVQHVVIVAPRGMGKTTLLLMLRFTVLSQDLAKRWQPVLFPEESYSIYDLADLWVEVLDHIASETGEVTLHEEVKKLKDAHPDSSSLEAVALASIKDWRDKNKKRLLLLIDNFDMILEQIGDEKDNASLRDVLMNDGTMMLVGGSTTFFKEARAYDQPLYNLFRIYNLDGLDSNQMEELLRRRAKIDGVENFEEILRANRSRLRVLEYFTDGNPRLVLMLYRVLTHSDISEVRRGLEKILDEVTPYYKAKIETLPPQQRKILDQIARISAQTREGLTPTEIASATRLPVNQVSSQLRRLADDGYVRAANIRGRSSYYTLSEPLYAIWHQMRFGRDARTRMNWLVAFLKGWYDAKELGIECQRLQNVFRSYLTALTGFEKTLELQPESIGALLGRGHCLAALSRKEEALSSIDRALSIQPDSAAGWYERGGILTINGDVEGAQQSFDKAIALTPDSHDFLFGKAVAMSHLDNNEESLRSVNRLVDLYPESSDAHFLRGALLLETNFDDAVNSFNRAFDSQSTTHRSMVNTLEAQSLKTMLSVITQEVDQVRSDWKELMQYAAEVEEQSTFHDQASSVLRFIAQAGHWDLARELITSSNLEEPLFPLVRGLDYLLTHEEALLEKLSPEVKSIVDEIVAAFKHSSVDFKDSFKVTILPTKRKAGTRIIR